MPTAERKIRDNHHEHLQYNNLHNWQLGRGTESAGMKGMSAAKQGYRRGKLVLNEEERDSRVCRPLQVSAVYLFSFLIF